MFNVSSFNPFNRVATTPTVAPVPLDVQEKATAFIKALKEDVNVHITEQEIDLVIGDILNWMVDDSINGENTPAEVETFKEWLRNFFLSVKIDPREAETELQKRIEKLSELSVGNAFALLSHAYCFSKSVGNEIVADFFEKQIQSYIYAHSELLESSLDDVLPYFNFSKIPQSFFDQKSHENPTPTRSRLGLIAAVGAVAGTMIGGILNITRDLNIKTYNCLAIKHNPLFSVINFPKQWEIKRFALLTPAVLLMGNVFHKAIKDRNTSEDQNTSLTKSLQNQFKLLPAKTLINVVALTAIASVANVIIKPYIGDFDPSGHVMLKYAATRGVVAALDHVTASGSSAMSAIAAATVSLTDGIFMANTAYCYHTPAELLAGGAIAAGIDATIFGVNRALKLVKK